MNILQTLVRLRDDLKLWVTNGTLAEYEVATFCLGPMLAAEIFGKRI